MAAGADAGDAGGCCLLSLVRIFINFFSGSRDELSSDFEICLSLWRELATCLFALAVIELLALARSMDPGSFTGGPSA